MDVAQRRRWLREHNDGVAEEQRAGFYGLALMARGDRPDRPARTAVLVGFTTSHGTVTAASDWGEPAERQRVRPALPGSYEAVFHETGVPRFLLSLREPAVAEALAGPRLERVSHYFEARLPRQFDAVIHVDETRALVPLERSAG